ncbi:universal stress protein [Frankia sp. CNm7]|uniref:Universal stress protein n=1 Tax=Frankia nepalensis TaxID=1836974 RepID=A0A937RD85_9ACTN|nr:universal stress protein [Frankia nepalensis]MBL7495881.1 universal stress protein [Frankia nepalensis]MBL7510392.1 universal stress protein [Frankia nepalensis]MBL7518630.1 universal stress protein [Frankia nepalensis]MBL7629991.1 universal stress protein [Frankia nepalensis]
MSSSIRILVGVDGSVGSEAALRWALREAALWSAVNGATGTPTVTALLVWSPDGLPSGVLRAAVHGDHDGLTQAAADMLERTIKRVGEPAAPVELRRIVREGDPVSVVTSVARDFDMLVVGERGHGALHRLTAGSVSQGIVHHAPVPVVVARPPKDDGTPVTEGERRPVVVGVDGSDLSLAALRWAAHAAAVRKVPLRVVHAWGGYDPMYAEVMVMAQASLVKQASDILDQAVKLGLDSAPGLTVDSVTSPDSGVRALMREAHGAQLLVVGNRGHGGFARLLLGSVSHQCVLHAACDVAVIRSGTAPAPTEAPAR